MWVLISTFLFHPGSLLKCQNHSPFKDEDLRPRPVKQLAQGPTARHGIAGIRTHLPNCKAKALSTKSTAAREVPGVLPQEQDWIKMDFPLTGRHKKVGLRKNDFEKQTAHKIIRKGVPPGRRLTGRRPNKLKGRLFSRLATCPHRPA